MKHTHRLSSLLLALAMLLSLCACGGAQTAEETPASETPAPTAAPAEVTSAETPAPAAPETITVIDHAGNSVTVPADIQRIAIVGIWPLASVLTVFFNSADKLVGIPAASMNAAKNSLLGELYPEILNAETGYMDNDVINVEELMKLDPDVVFYNVANQTYADQLQNAGLTAVGVGVNSWDYNCLETLNHWIELLSQMFPRDDKAQQVEAYGSEIYALVQERVSALSEEERARVFFLFQYSETSLLTSSSSFFGQWWCDAIGAVNVAREITTDNAAAVNMEQVYAWNPEVILITNYTTAQPADLLGNTVGSYDWSQVQAVQTGRLYKMPLGLYRSYTPGVDTPVTLLWMAKSVYPELFADLDVTAYAMDYYQTLFGLSLTEAQIAGIFTPTAAAADLN